MKDGCHKPYMLFSVHGFFCGNTNLIHAQMTFKCLKSFFDTIPLGLCLHCFLCGRPVPGHKDNNACFLVKSVESSSIIFIAGNINLFKAYGFGTFSAVCFSLFQENFTVRCKSLKNEQQNIDITGTLANSRGSRNGVKDSTLFVQASKQPSTE